MSNGIRIKIDVSKIIKEYLFKGKKGTYLDCVLWENRDGEDQYGNTHSLQQELPKEARERGEKAPYIGNGKWLQQRQAAPARQQQSRPRNNWREAKPSGVPPQTTSFEDENDPIPF